MKTIEVYKIDELEDKKNALKIVRTIINNNFQHEYELLEYDASNILTFDYDLPEDLQIFMQCDYDVDTLFFEADFTHDQVLQILEKILELDKLEEIKNMILNHNVMLTGSFKRDYFYARQIYFEFSFSNIDGETQELQHDLLSFICHEIKKYFESICQKTKITLNVILHYFNSEEYEIEYAREREYYFTSKGYLVTE